jgi:serine protease Do
MLLSLLLVPASAGAQGAPSPAAPSARVSGLADVSRSLEQLVERISPAVVQIFVTGYAQPDEEDPSVSLEPELERSSGSGVILDPDGYIVTNAHVVKDATRLEVELPLTGGATGRSIVHRRGRVVGAQVVAIDEETDLAVLKVPATGLPTLSFGDSDRLRPGQLVLAFGSPLGLESSVTMGVISAVARQLTPDDPMIYIQTDAPINPGSSGGAVVNTEGQLVGISTLIYSQSGGNEGIGFAAPSNIVRNVFSQIRAHGRVRRGDIGVNAQTVTPIMGEALHLPDEAAVVLSDVEPGGPADRAGLREGDVVLALDGKPMENGRQFRINLYTRGVGDRVTVDIIRGTSRLTVPVPVEERRDDVMRLADLVSPQNAVEALGIYGIDVTPRVEEVLGDLRHRTGVVVALVSGTTPYSQQGRLQPGDVIYSVNQRGVASVGALRAALDALPRNAPFVLQVERDGTLLFLGFRIEK